ALHEELAERLVGALGRALGDVDVARLAVEVLELVGDERLAPDERDEAHDDRRRGREPDALDAADAARRDLARLDVVEERADLLVRGVELERLLEADAGERVLLGAHGAVAELDDLGEGALGVALAEEKLGE